jgi:uncharacterized protein
MLAPDEQAAFLRSVDNVREAVERHLRSRNDQRSVIAFVSNLQRGVSGVVQAAIERGVTVACQAGCNYCCSARVEAMAPEVFRIAWSLASRPAAELDALVERLRAHVATQTENASWNQSTQCPFLTNGLCSIYDVRPSVCRKAHSQDAEKCRTNASEIPQDLGIVVGVEALAKGTSDAYARLGFDASGYELGQAVLQVLSNPLAESSWYSGSPVFASNARRAVGNGD